MCTSTNDKNEKPDVSRKIDSIVITELEVSAIFDIQRRCLIKMHAFIEKRRARDLMGGKDSP